jgi:hypothetical protein
MLLPQDRPETVAQPNLYEFGRLKAMLAQGELRFALVFSFFGCLLLTTYFFYAFVLPQTPGRMMLPSVSLVPRLRLWSSVVSLPLPIPHTGQLVAVSVIAFSIVGFAVYGLAVYMSWNREVHSSSLFVALVTALLFFSMIACALPNADSDIYDYMVYARVAAVHNSNPYYVAPNQFPDDPIYPYSSPRYNVYTDNKLPAWQLISILLARLAGDDVVVNLFVYRFTFLLFNAANIALIAIILRKLHPWHLLAGVVMYAWNPIVVVYGQSKTDTVMVFFLLLAILLLVTTKPRFAVIPLGLSALVKLITLPFVAVYWLRTLWLRRWRQLALDTLLLGMTVVVMYAPFWRGPRLLDQLGLLGIGGSSAPGVVRPLLAIVFALVVLWASRAQDGSHTKLLRSWAVVALFFSSLLTRFQFSWYLMTLLAVVSLTAAWPITLISVALSWMAFLINSWNAASTAAFPLPNPLALPRPLIYEGVVVIVALGTAAVVVWQKSRRGPHGLTR